MMSNPLRIVIIILLLIMAALYAYTGKQETHYQTIAPDEISYMLQDIDNWQADSLNQHLSLEAKTVVTPSQLSNVLNLYRPLGNFQRIEELHFSRLASALSLVGKKYIGYSGTARYSKGLAELTITLVEEDGQLKISNINMSSPAIGH